MFHKMPFILLALIISISLFGKYIPEAYLEIFYGMSLLIKSFIVFVLPFVVFGLLFKTAVSFSNKASKMIFCILGAVCCSNFLSTLLSYSIGILAYQFDLVLSFPHTASALQPAWEISLPKLIGNDYAMFSGLLLGVFLGWTKPQLAQEIASRLEKVVQFMLKVILFLIPLFIGGLVIKMQRDQVMGYIWSNYACIFATIASAVFIYIAAIYMVANRCNVKAAIASLRNMFPAAMVGLGSMSSAAAMPLTILGVEKSTHNSSLAASVIPATVNIHLIGDCFAIPIFAFAVMKSFGVSDPSFSSYLVFAGYFVLAKFSVAAVPGGGILVMLPILEKYLGFNAEMLSLITALYILFDPVITCANVLGNGGFAMIAEKLSPVDIKQKTCFIAQEAAPALINDCNLKRK